MPRVGASSTRAGIHPYLKPDFIWPEIEYGDYLCRISDDEFTENRIEEFRKKRTFYFNEYFSRLLRIPYNEKGSKIILSKNHIYEMGISKWDNDHLSRWKKLEPLGNGRGDDILLCNIGMGWWTAETIWIKAKL